MTRSPGGQSKGHHRWRIPARIALSRPAARVTRRHRPSGRSEHPHPRPIGAVVLASDRLPAGNQTAGGGWHVSGTTRPGDETWRGGGDSSGRACRADCDRGDREREHLRGWCAGDRCRSGHTRGGCTYRLRDRGSGAPPVPSTPSAPVCPAEIPRDSTPPDTDAVGDDWGWCSSLRWGGTRNPSRHIWAEVCVARKELVWWGLDLELVFPDRIEWRRKGLMAIGAKGAPDVLTGGSEPVLR